MRFFCIVKNGAKKHAVSRLLEQACNTRAIEFVLIEAETFDFSTVPQLTKEDLVYRVSIHDKAKRVEKLLLNQHAISFHTNVTGALTKYENVVDATILHEKLGLPIIPTIFDITTNKDLLARYVNKLDNFPIIVKVAGGCHGLGVIKADSMQSLSSIVDHFVANDDKCVLRKYIPHTKQGRIIVVGDKVVGSHENSVGNDFRSNVGEKKDRVWEAKEYSEDIQDMAVQAVNSLGLEFGGVDILFDKESGTPYIAEVNTPCQFELTQELTGIDIAGIMVDYLVEKSTR